MKCMICGEEIERDDNFCHHCGHWTSRGYVYFNENPEHLKVLEGKILKSENKLTTVFVLASLLLISSIIIVMIRGQSILKPFVYIKKQSLKYQYGYRASIMDTNHKYYDVEINTLEEANKIIEKDIDSQKWQCDVNNTLRDIEKDLSSHNLIRSISLCDIKTEEGYKIKEVIDRFFKLFPNEKGYLNTIAVTNAKLSDEFVAYFQPIYQFVNNNSDISQYNKVNKTQILLNSYYFLNDEMLSKRVSDVMQEGFYVEDATWESLIAHELGHYLIFTSLVKQLAIDNVTFVTKDNYTKIAELLNIINSQAYSNQIVKTALVKYNQVYNTNKSVEEFAQMISRYASAKDVRGAIISDETIAEAVHDYYLHENNASPCSLIIVSVLKEKMGY